MKPVITLVLIAGIVHTAVSSPLLDDNLPTYYLNAVTRDIPNPPPPSFESQDPPPGAPPLGTDPTVVNAWWQKLTADQQQNFSITAAGYVGSTSGIPIEVRNMSNTAVLGFMYRDLLGQYNSNTGVDDQATLKSKIIGMSDLATRLFGFTVSGTIDPIENDFQHLPGRSASGAAYLIQFSAEGQGRWVLSVGNPDTASTIVLTVPGLGRGLNDALYQDLNNNDATTDELIKLGLQPSESAQIIWVGYDSPSGTDISVNTAAGVAPALQSFQRGLQATRQAGLSPPHITVVGHSFGSVIVAETTLDGRQLIADDVIFIGSPGVPVDNAASLVQNSVTSSSHGSTRVWAGITGKDCIQCLPPPVRLGKYPTDPEFKATVFATDPNGDHGGYWQGVGLTNMGNIESGKLTAVTNATSSPPSCPNATSLTCISAVL